PRNALLFVALATASVPASLQAQADSASRLSLTVGPMSFDANGTGSTYTIALRGYRTIGPRWLAIEVGAAYMPFDEQFSITSTQVGALEGQLQLQMPLDRFKPYLGAGPGFVTYLTQAGGRHRLAPSANFGAGTRVVLTQLLGLVVDGRIRG